MARFIVIAGQSNGAYLSGGPCGEGGTDYSATEGTREKTPAGGWRRPRHNGVVRMANRLRSVLLEDVDVLNFAVGGASLNQRNDIGAGCWLGAGSRSHWPALAHAIETDGSMPDAFVFIQGETEGGVSPVTPSQRMHDMRAMISQVRDCWPEVQIIVTSVGRNRPAESGYLGTDSDWQSIKDADRAVCELDAKAIFVPQVHDCEFSTYGVHLDNAGYALLGDRIAQALLFQWSKATYYLGPEPTSFVQMDTTHIDVHLTHHGGTDFTPISGITGFSVMDFVQGQTVERPILSAVRQAPATVRLTVTALKGEAAVKCLYGRFPDVSGVLRDNAEMRLPIQSVTHVRSAPRDQVLGPV